MPQLELGRIENKSQAIWASAAILGRRIFSKVGLVRSRHIPPKLPPLEIESDRELITVLLGGSLTAWAVIKAARETPYNIPGPVGYLVDAAFPDDVDIQDRLFDACRDWFRSNDIKTVIAFMSDSVMDSRGIAYNQPTSGSYGMAVNPVYYIDAMKRYGFTVYMDMFEFDHSIVNNPYPTDRLAKRAERKIPDCRVITMSGEKIIDYIPDIVKIYNDAYADNDAFITLLESDVMKVATKMAKFVPHKSIIMIYSGDEPVGLMAAIPDFNKLKVTNPMTLLFARKAISQLRRHRGILFGVAQKYRTSGMEALLYQTYRENMKSVTDILVLGWIIDTNAPFLRLVKAKMGLKQTQTYALMQLDL